MLFLDLVHDRPWEPLPDEPEPPPRRRDWHLPWRPLAWFAAWCWLMALVPIVSGAFGSFAGYGVLLASVALAFWRIDRWCARQYWHGLKEWKS